MAVWSVGVGGGGKGIGIERYGVQVMVSIAWGAFSGTLVGHISLEQVRVVYVWWEGGREGVVVCAQEVLFTRCAQVFVVHGREAKRSPRVHGEPGQGNLVGLSGTARLFGNPNRSEAPNKLDAALRH